MRTKVERAAGREETGAEIQVDSLNHHGQYERPKEVYINC